MKSFLLISIIIIIFFFSWVPDPKLSNLGIIPNEIGKYLDQENYQNSRTAIPFILLGFVLNSYISKVNGIEKSLSIILFVFLTAIIAETGQVLLPNRNFDWGDIKWAMIGGIIGIIAAYLINFNKTIVNKN